MNKKILNLITLSVGMFLIFWQIPIRYQKIQGRDYIDVQEGIKEIKEDSRLVKAEMLMVDYVEKTSALYNTELAMLIAGIFLIISSGYYHRKYIIGNIDDLLNLKAQVVALGAERDVLKKALTEIRKQDEQ